MTFAIRITVEQFYQAFCWNKYVELKKEEVMRDQLFQTKLIRTTDIFLGEAVWIRWSAATS